jgi:hypothetical protein
VLFGEHMRPAGSVNGDVAVTNLLQEPARQLGRAPNLQHAGSRALPDAWAGFAHPTDIFRRNYMFLGTMKNAEKPL